MDCNDVIIVQQADGSFKCSPLTFRLSKRVKVRQNVEIWMKGEKTDIKFVLNEGENTPYFPNNVKGFFEKIHVGEGGPPKILTKFTREQVHQMMEESIKVLEEEDKKNEEESEGEKENKSEEEEEEEEFKRIKMSDVVKQSISQAFYPKDLVTPKNEDLESIIKHIDVKEDSVTPLVTRMTFITMVKNSPQKLDVECFVYRHTDRFCISDIDGTITKSDVRGVIATVVLNYDSVWTHKGVCKYYHELNLRGYKFVYLSARAVNLSDKTKRYVKNLRQEEYVENEDEDVKYKLPRGPVLCLMKSKLRALAVASIHSEDRFKTEFLRSLQDLFFDNNNNNNNNPFIAGFGNTPRDLNTYKALGMEHCFIINKKGVIEKSSYGMKEEEGNEGEKVFENGYVELNSNENMDNLFPNLF